MRRHMALAPHRQPTTAVWLLGSWSQRRPHGQSASWKGIGAWVGPPHSLPAPMGLMNPDMHTPLKLPNPNPESEPRIQTIQATGSHFHATLRLLARSRRSFDERKRYTKRADPGSKECQTMEVAVGFGTNKPSSNIQEIASAGE